MINNDILIRFRYALDIKNSDMVEIFKLGGIDLTKEEVLDILTKMDPDEDGLVENEVSHAIVESFFNGFIIFKRGRQEPKPGEPERPALSNEHVNNILLKKVKIALSLTSDDIMDLLDEAGVTITKGELSALLRKKGHKNYKECGDKYARNFLKGLTLRYRG
ncbi:DUF1456 family protein [Cytobacillus spongiae]|jgi:uncharacterized protein YehS (DUF1456 family)|uniref:DUF1456 family protein n=1 Tax=Cytobacillus spongiae TaxID=2901381 RepID=UPI001F39426B|nr:DUF1456 family protein [Cytobacillus spongiae]UII56566.1 DUF1456 family protein [Cytobacillus spongiae]